VAKERVKITQYRGTPQTVSAMFAVANGDRGQQSWRLRKKAEEVIRHVTPRDYWSEALAIYYWTCGPSFRYTRDPLRVEQLKDPVRMLEEIENDGVTLGDCDDLATFLVACLGTIGQKARIVTVGFRPLNPRYDKSLIIEPNMRLMTSKHPRLGGPFTHVFAQARKPKAGWVTLDPVAGPRTAEMQRRVKQLRIYVSN